MNIQRFVEARKAAGFSQSELAEGICTQATLSRFENNGQVPSLKILIQLCNRLGLPIGELFPKVGIQQPEISAKMAQGEFFLITSEYQQLESLLTEIACGEIADHELTMRYHYLKGFMMIYREAPITDILFTFDQLLLEEQKGDSELYRLLGYTGIGLAYSREQDREKAEFYFDQVFGKITEYPIRSTEDTWRVLNILFHCGEFYGQQGELETSNALLNYAVTICSDNHVTYYLARAAYQLALNGIQSGDSQELVLEQLADARAFAKINRNRILLEKINEKQQELL